MSYFSKVTYGQYIDSLRDYPIWQKTSAEDYDDLKIPKRATSGSAGYDLYAPFDIELKPGEYNKFPLGIRWVADDVRTFLMIVPRSGLGFKYGVRLANSVGIVDSDYFCSNNEGNIWAKLTSEKPVIIKKGEAILQGIILKYETVNNDTSEEKRNGGFGSTDKKGN